MWLHIVNLPSMVRLLAKYASLTMPNGMEIIVPTVCGLALT